MQQGRLSDEFRWSLELKNSLLCSIKFTRVQKDFYSLIWAPCSETWSPRQETKAPAAPVRQQACILLSTEPRFYGGLGGAYLKGAYFKF